MSKKGFTLLELILTLALFSILAASSVPFLLKIFNGYSEVFQYKALVNSLQEISTVISRNVINDNKSVKVDKINDMILQLYQLNNDDKIGNDYYRLFNGIRIKKLKDGDVVTYTYKNGGNNISIPYCKRITLTALKDDKIASLSFILYPANEY